MTTTVMDIWNTTDEGSDMLTAAPAAASSLTCTSPKWVGMYSNNLAFFVIAETAVCVFGVLTNILNIIVLTRKEMTSATSTILTGLAVVDMLAMLVRLPEVRNLRLLDEEYPYCYFHAYVWAVYSIVDQYAFCAHNGISIGLTLTLAIWRLIAVVCPLKCRLWCSRQKTLVAMVACYIIPSMLCSVSIVASEITKISDLCGGGAFSISTSKFGMANGKLLWTLNFLMVGLLTKVLPGIALAIIFLWLIWALHSSYRKRLLLSTQEHQCGTMKPQSRTTQMLIVVLLLFLITELPLGVLLILASPLAKMPHLRYCFYALMHVFRLLATMNNASSFFVYLGMNHKFRSTLCRLLKPLWCCMNGS